MEGEFDKKKHRRNCQLTLEKLVTINVSSPEDTGLLQEKNKLWNFQKLYNTAAYENHPKIEDCRNFELEQHGKFLEVQRLWDTIVWGKRSENDGKSDGQNMNKRTVPKNQGIDVSRRFCRLCKKWILKSNAVHEDTKTQKNKVMNWAYCCREKSEFIFKLVTSQPHFIDAKTLVFWKMRNFLLTKMIIFTYIVMNTSNW